MGTFTSTHQAPVTHAYCEQVHHKHVTDMCYEQVHHMQVTHMCYEQVHHMQVTHTCNEQVYHTQGHQIQVYHMQVHNVSSITMCCTTTTIDNVRSNVNALLQAASSALTCKAQQNGPVRWVVLCRL
jgi:hypothetical protein